MRKNLISLSILAMLFSCSEDILVPEQSDRDSIEHAQEWFDQNVPSLATHPNGRTKPQPKNVVWKKGIAHATGKKATIEVPLEYETGLIAFPENVDKGIQYKNLTKLLMFRNEKGGYNLFVMRIMPDPTSLQELDQNTYHKKTSNFTGEIIYYTWSGEPLVYARYERGKRKELKYAQTSGDENSNTRAHSECYVITTNYYQVVCYEDYCFQPVLMYTDIDYYCDYTSNEDSAPGDDLGGGGGNYGDEGGSGESGGNSEVPGDTNELRVFEQDYKTRMSPSELQIYDGMNRFQQVAYLTNAQEALTLAQMLYPDAQLNTKADAFRHAYFSYLNVYHLGLQLTENLGNAHEDMPGQPQIQKDMDLFNNQVGRDAYNNHAGMSIYEYLQNLMSSGGLRIIVNGVIVPSNN